MNRLMRVVAVAALACGLLGVGTARAVFPPPVKDDGKFFTKEGLDRANKKIRDIYEKYKKDVVVETMTSLTADEAKKMDEEGKGKYFAKLTRDRSVALGLNGIYILVLKKPQHLQVHMDPETQKRMFTAANRKTLIEKIVAQFKEDQFDQGLHDGLDAIEAALKANSKSK
jgi:uncharacterized membrane protein YgcG